jgi:hypothetical protein
MWVLPRNEVVKARGAIGPWIRECKGADTAAMDLDACASAPYLGEKVPELSVPLPVSRFGNEVHRDLVKGEAPHDLRSDGATDGTCRCLVHR